MTDAERRAELAMQIMRLVQMHGRPPAPTEHWIHFPRVSEALSWERMRSRLAGLAKPVLILPGNEAGMVATWGLDQFPRDQVAAARDQFENQVEYYTAKAKRCGLEMTSMVRLRKGDVLASLTVAELIVFFGEYAFGARISIGPAEVEGEGVFMIFCPGGGIGRLVTDGEALHPHGPECEHEH